MAGLPPSISHRDKYGPAMSMLTQAQADEYLEHLVDHCMRTNRKVVTREQALEQERASLGYFAGYFDHTVRVRVEKLFACTHPLLGPAIPDKPPTTEECLDAARRWFEDKQMQLPMVPDDTVLDLEQLDEAATAVALAMAELE